MITIDVDKRLGEFELHARLEAPAHGITALFGHSGAGKTSLINLIAGVSRPDRGVIRVGDTTLFDSQRGIDLPIERRAIGYVFQDARLLPHLSVRANLMYGAHRARRLHRSARLEIDAVLPMLGIAALLDRRAHQLSTGQRQRVAIGRALLSQPRLLLMDEPLAALDGPRKLEMLPYIERLRDEFGIPIFYVSHALEEITRLADYLVILSEGQSVACGDLFAVMDDARHTPYLGQHEAGVVLSCTVHEHSAAHAMTTLVFDGGSLRVPQVALAPGQRVRVRVRAHDVAVSLKRAPELSISNQIEGRILEIVAREGPYVEAVIGIGTSRLRSLLTRESAERLALTPGMPAWALVRSVALDQRSVAA